ncbi:putative quinol monooxygenase [Rhodococcus aerolatus]
MIVVIAEATTKPEKADEVAGLLATTAASSRGDEGCLSYSFLRDVEDPTRFCSIETWESKAHLDAHMGQAHTQQLLGALPDMVTAPPVITVHEVSASTPYG